MHHFTDEIKGTFNITELCHQMSLLQCAITVLNMLLTTDIYCSSVCAQIKIFLYITAAA